MAKTTITEPFLLKLEAVISASSELTVSNLSVKAGLSNSAIRQMFDQNRSPRLLTMRKICTALGTTVEEFMSLAQTEEEREIVRLISQLPAPLRHELLGYGRALSVQASKSNQESDEEKL